jgi:hypothetical protein
MDEKEVTEKLLPFMYEQILYFYEHLRNSDLGQKLTVTILSDLFLSFQAKSSQDPEVYHLTLVSHIIIITIIS